MAGKIAKITRLDFFELNCPACDAIIPTSWKGLIWWPDDKVTAETGVCKECGYTFRYPKIALADPASAQGKENLETK